MSLYTPTGTRNLIPFVDPIHRIPDWTGLLESPIFQSVQASPPQFSCLDYERFEICDLDDIVLKGTKDDKQEGNVARSAGTQHSISFADDLQRGYDPTQRPLIVVLLPTGIGGALQRWLWDGYNRFILLTEDLGVRTYPAFIYTLKEGWDVDDAYEIVSLSMNNHSHADEHTRRDFILAGINWVKRHGKKTNDEVEDWINSIDHKWNRTQIETIAKSIIVEGQVTAQIKHFRTGSEAKAEVTRITGHEFKYKQDDPTNPMVVCTKEAAYVDDLFLAHMTKFVRDLRDFGKVESTEIIGYTKGCQTVKEVEAQRAAAQARVDELDDLVCDYVHAKSKLNGQVPYKWNGFIPQLYGRELGEGIKKDLVN